MQIKIHHYKNGSSFGFIDGANVSESGYELKLETSPGFLKLFLNILH